MPAPLISTPAGFVPEAAVAFAAADGSATRVDATHPLPVGIVPSAPSAAPLAGTLSASATVGPFVAQQGRAVWLTLAGGWAGTATLLRSIDGGATRLPLTAGGQPWGVFTANAQEPVVEEPVAGASYYLQVALSSGTLGYRIAQ